MKRPFNSTSGFDDAGTNFLNMLRHVLNEAKLHVVWTDPEIYEKHLSYVCETSVKYPSQQQIEQAIKLSEELMVQDLMTSHWDKLSEITELIDLTFLSALANIALMKGYSLVPVSDRVSGWDEQRERYEYLKEKYGK